MMNPDQAFAAAANLYHARKLHEAELAARRIVEAHPNHVMAMNLLGVIAHDVGRNDIALTWLNRAVRIDPSLSLIYNNMGECYRAMGQADQAIKAYRAAIARNPQDPNARNNMAIVYVGLGYLDAAIATWREVIAVCPDYHSAYNNLANTLQLRGHAAEAAEWHRRSIQLDPNWTAAHSNLLRDLQHLPGITGEALLEEHRNWWRTHGERLAQNVPPHDNDRNPDRPLVVGWLSPDFREHAVAFFLEPVLAHFDREKFQFIAYSELPHEDEWTKRLRTCFHEFRPIFGVPDEQVERQIRADRVDILVDLAGHTGKNRAAIFCRRPAPVQASFLGYPCTTGIETIDWRITDPKADPVGMTETHYTEKLIRLPRTAWCFRPLNDAPEVSDLPADRNGYITFGSFNNFAKVNDDVIALWLRILQRVPNSRLLLKYTGMSEPSVRQTMRDQFAQVAVDPERLELRGRSPDMVAHLGHYRDMDIALDTFPYNGTTTTCEALWMGVPVLTVAGNMHLSRVGASLLESAGLPKWIAKDVDEYVAKAADFAADIPRLRDLRNTMRQRLNSSPLRDEPAYTRDLEAALREMWRTWCRK